MAIMLNPNCCACAPPYPAWTVYHENVHEKLHYYVARFGVTGSFEAKYLYMFYEGTSGSYLVYKNCPTSSGINSWEYDSSATARLYLQKTSFIPTGVSALNPWIKAARIEKFEIQGLYYDTLGNSGINVNSTLQYQSGSQYTMGMHYCGIQGLSGNLGLASGGMGGFSLFPFIGGKFVASNNGILSQITTNSEDFTEYNGTEDCTSCGRFWEDWFTMGGDCLYYASGTSHYSSGIFSFSRTAELFSGLCNCPSLGGSYPLVQALYDYNCINYFSGTTFSLNTYSYPLEILDSGPTSLCSGRVGNWLPLFGYNGFYRTARYQGGYSCFIGPLFDGFLNPPIGDFLCHPYLDYYSNGGYYTSMGQCSGNFFYGSSIYFCLSDNAPYSGYSYMQYGPGFSSLPYSAIAPPKPILAIIRRGKYLFSQQIVGQAVIAEVGCGSTVEPTGYILRNPSGDVGFPLPNVQRNDRVINIYNYDMGVSIFVPSSGKHLLEDFNEESYFEPQVLTPWVGYAADSGSLGVGIYDAYNFYCCPSGGSFSTSWSFSNTGSLGTYSYGCSPLLTISPWSFPSVCNGFLGITTSDIEFTNTQLSIPESESCI